MAVAKTHPIKLTLKAAAYEELLDRCEAASVSVARLKADLRDTRAKIDELVLKDEGRRRRPPVQANS